MSNLYNQRNLDTNWIDQWKKNKDFLPNYFIKSSYCIVIPPPNITGKLHMGHAFQCTLMDILIRYYKMNNFSTLLKFGCDHAGIATQILLEQKFKNKKNLVKEAQSWKKQAIKNISSQISNLGFLVNWNTSRFTLDKHFSYAVKYAFISLYEEKLIYKSTKLVNWDMSLKTAISDLETVYKTELSKLYYIKYKLVGSEEFITVATTRPETIFADVAIAVNPNDTRCNKLLNSKVFVPIINRIIPILYDDAVDPGFGTGFLKVTPCHDFNDFDIAEKYSLPLINIFTEDGFLNDNVPSGYRNITIFDARKKVVDDLFFLNLIDKVLNYENKIPRGDRTGNIIEPFLKEQFYLSVNPLINPIKDLFNANKIKILPKKWKKNFVDWIENIKDWCISRQIWWGHRIPLWYDSYNNAYAGYNYNHIKKKYSLSESSVLRQETDVLDTWFSSALWPFASLGWPVKKLEFVKFYPTSTLITGFDIIFFWVIRMLMFGIKFTAKLPFDEIFVHGLIRDSYGIKMSKTKGNVLDPLDIVNGISKSDLIKKQLESSFSPSFKEKIIFNINSNYPNGIDSYGVDALRLTFASIATDSIALKMDIKKVNKYKNFCNKLWNASNFLLFHNSLNLNNNFNFKTSIYDNYILERWERFKRKISSAILNRKFSLSIEIIYIFFWNEFCDWYIEISKIFLNLNKYKSLVINNLFFIFKEFILILHPFAPVITAEIWNIHFGTNILNISYPCLKKMLFNINIIKYIKFLKFLVCEIRKQKMLLIFPRKKLVIFFQSYSSFYQFEKIFYLVKGLLKFNNINIFYDNKGYESSYIEIANGLYFLSSNFNNVFLKTVSSEKILKIEKEILQLETTLKNINFLDNADKNVIKLKKEKLNKLNAYLRTIL